MERGDVWTCLYEGYASKPRPANGLLKTSWIATEKIMAVPVGALKNKVGQLSKSDMQKVSESLRKVLGL